MRDWSPEKTKRLIKLYQENPALWDPTRKDYKNSDLRNDIWSNISKELECRDAEKKMNILIVQYRREMRKMRARTEAGKPPEACASKWFAFEAMSFLKDKKRSSKSSNVIKIKSEMMSPHDTKEFNDENVKSDPSTSPVWTANNPHSIESLENVEYDPTPKAPKDEYAAFGEMISIKLRKLPSLHAKKRAMQTIMDAIFQVEIESEEDCEMVYVKMD